ncbi:MAG: hypothetical protein ACLTSZ_03055 [Lachnospiraceae bacterium]
MYQGDVLKEAVLDGKPLELFDIWQIRTAIQTGGDDGAPAVALNAWHDDTGQLIRGSCGSRQMTARMVLLQKRVFARDSFRRSGCDGIICRPYSGQRG